MGKSLTTFAALLLLLVALPGAVSGATTTVDCGTGDDLQAAIRAAHSGDTIRIKGRCRGNFTIIRKDLTLRGAPRATLDGRGRGATLKINHTGTEWLGVGDSVVVLRDLTITGSGGDTWYADGVHAWGGEVILDHSRIKGNRGSGLFGDGVVTIRIVHSSIRDNARLGIDGGESSRVFLTDSWVMANGTHGVRSLDFSVRGSTVSRNGGDGYAGHQQSHIEARRSRFNNNAGRGVQSQGIDLRNVTAAGNRGGGIRGGWDNGLPYWVRIDHSTIIGNRTPGDGGGLDCSGTCLVTGSLIAENRAAGNGGGVYLRSIDDGGNPVLVARDSRIKRNSAGGTGGGVHNETPLEVLLVRTPLLDNQPDQCSGC